jgi:pimeloyl-ACP methyl ester carboxylesterase
VSRTAGVALAPDGRPRIYWESTGDGPPVLLIMGLGLSGGAWWRTVPVLARRLRVITFDARGIGRSPSLRRSYSVEAMADDAVSVLDGVGLDRAHVYGFSLGGMVAQSLALRHPDRVRSLVLGATHAGGRHVVRPDDDVIAFFKRRLTMEMEEAAWASVEYKYGPRCREHRVDLIAEDIERRLENPFSPAAYKAQLYAAAMHNCHGRLSRIDVPTMVVHGAHDRIIPVDNARMMDASLPNSRLRILDESGHLYATEEPQVDEEIAAFLDGHP